jgi:hypothetical protein
LYEPPAPDTLTSASAPFDAERPDYVGTLSQNRPDHAGIHYHLLRADAFRHQIPVASVAMEIGAVLGAFWTNRLLKKMEEQQRNASKK